MDAKVLVLPGYQNSGEGHWQTLWEQSQPTCSRVQMPDWDHPARDAWCRTLDDAVAAVDAPIVFAAHSLGCLTVAFWAAQYASPGQAAKVAGALLVAVPDPTGDQFPTNASGYAPVPLAHLPFPSIVVASTDDAYGSVPYSQACARAWGSSWFEIGARGHINSDSGLGDWDEGQRWLATLAGARRGSV